MNINQQVIRYVLQNASVIILFVMPMITMRTYSEEKRSGTIELLLTSPVTDVEIILGKFLGALGLYVAMLLVTMLYIGDPVRLRQPGVAAARRGVSRAAADGRRFVSLGLLISSTTNNQIVAGHHHLRGVPDAVDRRLVRRIVGTDDRARSRRTCRSPSTSTTSRRASSTPSTCIYYLSLITFGLFLTAKSVDTRKVARLDAMLKRILGLLGWLGVALVFAAVAIRFLEAGVAAVLQRPGDRRPGLHAALHPEPVARDRPGVRRTPGALRHARGRQRRRRARDPRRDQLSRHAAQQALGPDGGEAVLAVGPDARRCCRT